MKETIKSTRGWNNKETDNFFIKEIIITFFYDILVQTTKNVKNSTTSNENSEKNKTEEKQYLFKHKLRDSSLNKIKIQIKT